MSEPNPFKLAEQAGKFATDPGGATVGAFQDYAEKEAARTWEATQDYEACPHIDQINSSFAPANIVLVRKLRDEGGIGWLRQGDGRFYWHPDMYFFPMDAIKFMVHDGETPYVVSRDKWLRILRNKLPPKVFDAVGLCSACEHTRVARTRMIHD